MDLAAVNSQEPTTKFARDRFGQEARWLRLLRTNPLIVASAVLLVVSLFFFVQVERFKAELTRTDAGAFASGDIATITGIIDGDEVTIQKATGEKAHVRIVGIQSFDPVVNDPVLAQAGKACFSFLSSNYVGEQAQLTINETLKVDSSGRLLAYLSVANSGTDELILDLGLDLIRRGLTLAYVRYPFAREAEYLEAAQQAKNDRTGLWGDDNIVDRAEALEADWQRERNAEDDAS